MNKCKCGSFAINEHTHGRKKGKHSDLCDVCYWREEAKLAHRRGWEQAKREAVKGILNASDANIPIQPSFTYRGIVNMIASMEYKEAE